MKVLRCQDGGEDRHTGLKPHLDEAADYSLRHELMAGHYWARTRRDTAA